MRRAARAASAHQMSLGRAAAPSDRGMPRKPIAKTLAKQVTASPAVNASRAPEIANIILIGVEDRTADRRIVCNVSHSLTKPLSGGNAEIDKHADQKEGARPRHAAHDAAEPVEIARAGPSLDRAGADEKQCLVNRVIGEMIKRGDQRDACDNRMAARHGRSSRRRSRPRRCPCSRSCCAQAGASSRLVRSHKECRSEQKGCRERERSARGRRRSLAAGRD